MLSNLLKLCCVVPQYFLLQIFAWFKIEVDASASGAGAVLLQDDDDGVEHPVAYFSKSFYHIRKTTVLLRRRR